MTLKQLQLEAKELRAMRANCDVEEAVLRGSLSDFLPRGSAKEAAVGFGVSEQYLCDIRKGRRKISDEFLDKLCGGKLRG